jgi:hypothetical protein
MFATYEPADISSKVSVVIIVLESDIEYTTEAPVTKLRVSASTSSIEISKRLPSVIEYVDSNNELLP